MAEVGAKLEREERMLLRQIARDHQDGLAVVKIGGGGQRVRFAAQRVQQRCDVAGAVVIDIVRAQNLAREVLQIIIFFVSGVVRADHGELALARFHFLELPATIASASDHETGSSLPFFRTSGDCSRSADARNRRRSGL